MRRNWIVTAVVGAALAFMVWAGVHRMRAGGPRLSGGDQRLVGTPAPDFALTDVKTGRTVRLSDFRGRAVLLNFWATWCGPCKVEIPWFVDFQKEYGPQGLAVIGIAMDDAGRDEIASFSERMGINYLTLLGNNDVAYAYGGVEALPTTFYIGRDGRIVKRVFGLRGHGDAEDNVKLALGEQQASAGER